MKKIALILVLVLVAGIAAGCMGTPVIYYSDCTCPTGSHGTNVDTTKPTVGEGAVKTGLAIVTSVGKSENAKVADYDVTLVAVTVDDKGVITDCIIDSIGAKVNFDATGKVTSDLTAEVKTKNELGDDYGMKAYGGAKYEWYEQAAALADYAVGKTVEELKSGAIDESGKAPEGSDLASTATIYLGGYVSAIEEAVKNAQHLGAQAGDELKLATVNSIGSSASATAEKAGTAQLDSTVTALTVKDGVITSCYIDSVQAKVAFDNKGVISTDLTAAVQTKNQLGDKYGMVAWGGAKHEWNEQAASFAADADLSSSVTIAIGDFQKLIAKALA